MSASTAKAAVDEIDADFLPAIYDIVRSIEREINETNASQKALNREQSDCHQKMLNLKEKFQKCRDVIGRVEGIDFRKEEQLSKFEAFKEQLVMKRELLLRYKHCCPIDTTPKL
ncbi:mediator of RNA polymerase II transcription subunit 9-like protein [Dinothrombium tinctorium]|uniref:Mediator of RNA polymerase II transcription subunit 9 n=1 Tax=Dinothrombium tinctorium TaxID=1965070 RepID=A0A3S3S177_9ACAR|nr:mediator of RNA polymerase II transcription subunit 9-like protein [Dinothrombium tinctorium]